MLRKIKEISKDTLVYGFGQGLNGLISFLLLPIYTQYLSPIDYGYLSMFEVLRTLINMLIGFGISSALFRYYYYSDDPEQRKSVVSTGFLLLISISVFLLILVIPLRAWISNQLFENREYGGFVLLTFMTSFCFNIIAYRMYLNRIRRKPISFLVIQLTLSFIRIGLNIFFVVILKYNFRGILWGNFIASAAVALVMAIILLPEIIRNTVSRFYLKKMVVFSAPILAANIIFYFQNSFDRVLITRFLDFTQNGLYSFGSKIGSIVFFGFITPFKIAWPPYAMSISREKDSRTTYANILLVYAGASLILSTALVLFSKELVGLLGHGKYDLASTVILFIVYGNFFRGLYYTISIGIDLAEKTHLTIFTQIVGTVTSLLLNFILIPRIGIQGAGIAFLSSNLLIFITVFTLAQRTYHIPYPIVRFLVLVGVNLPLAIMPLESVMLKVVLFVLLCILTCFMFFYDPLASRYRAYVQFRSDTTKR